MKAKLEGGAESVLLTLIPETVQEQEALQKFATNIARPHLIGARGFKYLDAEVEFLVTPMPRKD